MAVFLKSKYIFCVFFFLKKQVWGKVVKKPDGWIDKLKYDLKCLDYIQAKR